MQEPAGSNPQVKLSVVVPALNEAGNVARLVGEVECAVVAKGIAAELIVVDDGSDDATAGVVQELSGSRPWLRLVRHAKRCGQSAALASGIRAARGAFVATLDADLQNDPADLPRLLEIVETRAVDMAQGMRARRRDNPVRKVSSWVGRAARRIILSDPIRDTGCSTRIVRAEIARQFPLQFAGVHRFLPVYARMLGARIVEVPVSHRPRQAGVTKYGVLNRAFVGLVDCFALRWMRRRLRIPTICPETAP